PSPSRAESLVRCVGEVAAGSHPELRPPALVLEDVVREFAAPRRTSLGGGRAPVRAVGGVSLTLPAGGSVAIVGESGSGKTTLLRMVVGLLEPTAGQVLLGAGPRPQLVFQDAGASLTTWLPIGGQIAERLARLGVAREQRSTQVRATLEAVGLPP